MKRDINEPATFGRNTSLAMERAKGNVEDDASRGEFEPGELARSEMEAQARYGAAIEYLNSVSVFYLKKMNRIQLKALKIAAGIKID